VPTGDVGKLHLAFGAFDLSGNSNQKSVQVESSSMSLAAGFETVWDQASRLSASASSPSVGDEPVVTSSLHSFRKRRASPRPRIPLDFRLKTREMQTRLGKIAKPALAEAETRSDVE
jgi:hypothetical protein